MSIVCRPAISRPRPRNGRRRGAAGPLRVWAAPAWLALAALVLALWSGPAGAADDPMGMGVYLYRTHANPALTISQRDLAVAAGATMTREEFNWSWIEPVQGQYNQSLLAFYDAMVDGCLAQGMEVLGLIAYGVPWLAGSEAPSTAEHYQAFARFVAFLVERYRGKIRYWEIWNEPNNPSFWGDDPSAAEYVALLQHASAAAKAVDPEVKIVGVASVADDWWYILQVCLLGGLDHMDVLSVHPYPWHQPLETSQEAAFLSLYQTYIDTYGGDQALWVTEVGWGTAVGDLNARGVTPQRQAELLARAYLTCLAKGVERVFWYDFKDDGVSPSDLEQTFGVVTNQAASPPLAPKLAYRAFAILAGALAGHRFSADLGLGGDRFGLAFAGPQAGQYLWALWIGASENDEPSQLVDLVVPGRVTRVVDMYGTDYPYLFANGVLSLEIGPGPVYVTILPATGAMPWVDYLILESPGGDADGDGLSDAQEAALGTDPGNPDSDGDLMPDGWEVAHGLDPRDPADAGLDPDSDGLSNLEEYQGGSDPHELPNLFPIWQFLVLDLV